MEALKRSNKLQGNDGGQGGGGVPKHEKEIVGDGNVDVGENNGGHDNKLPNWDVKQEADYEKTMFEYDSYSTL